MQVDASKEPIKETHIVDGINKLSVRVVSIEPAVIGVGIIGQSITQGVINGGTNIGSNLITNVLTNSSKIIFDTNMFQLNTLQSETLVIGPQNESMKSNNRIICTPSDSRNIRGKNISRIDTPGVNEDIWSAIDTTSNVMSCTENVEKFDTIVHSSTTQERNLESSRIKEVNVKSIFPEPGKETEPRVQVNPTNSVLSESPKFITLGHPIVETADIQNLDFVTATITKNCNGLRRVTERDDRLGYTHDSETMSETTA